MLENAESNPTAKSSASQANLQPAEMQNKSDEIKSKLVIKAVRNVRRGYEADEAGRGMYRPEIKLDLQRSRLLTDSYKKTDGEPMVIRRAKALANILANIDIYIQDWEKIIGNQSSTPEGLFFGIDMNWRSVARIVRGQEGDTLLDDAGRAELAEMIAYWKGKSMSDRQQELFSGDVLKYWKFEGTFLWSHWSELGIPNYEKIFRVGLKGIIAEAQDRLAAIDNDIPADYVQQKEFLQAAIMALEAVVGFAHRYAQQARRMAATASDAENIKRLEEIAVACEWVPENPPRSFPEALQSFFFIHVVRYMEYSSLGIGVCFDKIFGPYYEKGTFAAFMGEISRTWTGLLSHVIRNLWWGGIPSGHHIGWSG